MVGLARVDGVTYCFCGVPLAAVKVQPAQQLSVDVQATTTTYSFAVGAATLAVTFYNVRFVVIWQFVTHPVRFSLSSIQMHCFLMGTPRLALCRWCPPEAWICISG